MNELPKNGNKGTVPFSSNENRDSPRENRDSPRENRDSPQLPRSVERSVKLYKSLVKVYPASFRKEYGDEMALVFRDLAAGAWRRRGFFRGLLAVWFHVLADFARSVPREYMAAFHRRIEMKNSMRVGLWVLLAAFVYYEFFLMIAFVGMGIVYLMAGTDWLTWFESGSHESLFKLPVLYLSPFVAGMILARVKPFFRPSLTAPLGVMIPWGVIALGEFLDKTSVRVNGSWYVWAGQACMGIVFVASLGLTAWAGCVVSNKLSGRLPKPQIA
jgi:hypothetical protein